MNGTAPDRSQDLLRWLAVVPVALLSGFVGRNVGGIPGLLRGTGSPESLLEFLTHLPWGLAVVWGGAAMAPRARMNTARILAAGVTVLSLQMHILTQSSPGLVNALHFAGETTGALLGLIVVSRRQTRRPDGCGSPSDEPN